MAKQKCKPDIAKLLIEKGANINVKDDIGRYPLELAATGGECGEQRADIAKLLIEKGANVNSKSNYGDSPLAIAIETRQTNTAKLLIEKGANVNVKNRELNTPLILAVKSRNADIVKLLIEKGADLDIKDRGGFDPLDYAIEAKDYTLVRLFTTKMKNLSNYHIIKLIEISTIPANTFSDKNIELSTKESLISKKAVLFTFTNKLPKFVRVSAVSMYLNGKIIGTKDLGVELSPEAITETTYDLPITTNMLNSLITGKDRVVPFKYGFAVKYTIDNKSETLYVTKPSQITLW